MTSLSGFSPESSRSSDPELVQHFATSGSVLSDDLDLMRMVKKLIFAPLDGFKVIEYCPGVMEGNDSFSVFFPFKDV